MSRTNQTRHIEWIETFKYKCRIDVFVIKNSVGIMKNVDVNPKN